MPKPLPPDVDDCTIPHEELLYVRVIADKDSIIFDHDLKRWRPTSSALKSREEPLSVDLSSISTPQETKDRATIPGHFHVAAFTAITARKYGCRVVRDPDEATPTTPANPAHALVFGDHKSKSGGLTDSSQARRIAHGAWIILLNEHADWPPRAE
jgi:hypothetical protein